MKKITTVNPATEEKLLTYKTLSKTEIEAKLELAQKAYLLWKKTTFSTRGKLFEKVAEILTAKKEFYAKLMALEMGKPVKLGIAEVEKCAWICRYYAQNAENFLENEVVSTEAQKSYVIFEPIGIIFAVMPWNYPFNQVFRFAVPALMAGNIGILKHASNVSGCSLAIEKIFPEAGFPKGVFQSFVISSEEVADVIKDSRIKAVTLTGSEKAGASVAGTAGNNIKKSVLELGGSDAFIVFDDADLEKVIQTAAFARIMNSGQVCICAKRFIVQEKIFDEFVKKLKKQFEKVKIGDPFDPATEMGPLTNAQILEGIQKQVRESIKLGAKLVCGGKKIPGKGFYFEPTILINIKRNMPVFCEETFGPVAVISPFKTDDEAIEIANDTRFGLGASIWTKNKKRAERFANEIESGSVFINTQVRSDPRLPFGGTKSSGYGRELSSYGIKEFVNIKTVWMN